MQRIIGAALGGPGGSDAHPEPEACRARGPGIDWVQPHAAPTRMIEEAHAVAEKLRCDEDEHLVEGAGIDALACDIGAEDVHVPAAGSSLRGCDGCVEIVDEGDVRGPRLGRREWAILDSNQGPLPYQRSALTD